MQLSLRRQSKLLQKYGPWAFVSGASSGIGLAVATDLANAGFHLVINSRGEEALQKIAADFRTKFNIEVKVIAADLSDTNTLPDVVHSIQELNISLAVLSAGYGTSGEFSKNSVTSEINMLRLNCEALLYLTHYFSNKFVQQKRGGIILLSSVAAFQGIPYAANYAATKAYVQILAEGIYAELKPHGVDVLAVAPGPVSTGFGKRANMKMGIALQPSQVSVSILNALGCQTTVYPGWLSKLLVYSVRILPRWMKIKVSGSIMHNMTS